MPINVVWKNPEKTILVFSYVGRWDLNDFYQSNEKGNLLLDEVQYPVHLVLDVSASRTAPNGLMNAMTNTTRKLHVNTGVMIMVGLNVFARALISTYFKIYPAMYKMRPIYFASNDNEIQAIIRHFAGANGKAAQTS
jgi:hypothetical protein